MTSDKKIKRNCCLLNTWELLHEVDRIQANSKEWIGWKQKIIEHEKHKMNSWPKKYMKKKGESDEAL